MPPRMEMTRMAVQLLKSYFNYYATVMATADVTWVITWECLRSWLDIMVKPRQQYNKKNHDIKCTWKQIKSDIKSYVNDIIIMYIH